MRETARERERGRGGGGVRDFGACVDYYSGLVSGLAFSRGL